MGVSVNSLSGLQCKSMGIIIFTASKRSLRRLCFYTCLSVILFTGEGIPACSMPCRGWYASMPCRSPGPHPRGKLRGLAGGGGGIQAHSQGEVEGSGLGGLQVHTRGSPGPHQGGLQAHTQEDIQVCTEADTPQQMATAVGGTHPTGMHSCFTRADSTSIFDKLILPLTHVF